VAAIAARQLKPIVVNDPGADDRLADSPAAASALGRVAAVPVVSESTAIGVIGVSRLADKPEIGAQDIRLLEAVAVQTANAIQRAQLFEQTQEALAVADAATRRYLRDAWDAFWEGGTAERQGYLVGPGGTMPAEDLWLPEMARALERDEVVSLQVDSSGDGEQARASLAVPLRVRGQVIGVVDFLREGAAEGWTEAEQEFIQSLVEQIGDSIEGERQFAQTQATLAQTERMYEASQRISTADSRDEILQVVLDTAASTTADRAIVFAFDPPVTSGTPSSLELVAFWDRGNSDAPAPLGTKYAASEYPLARLVGNASEPFAVSDVQTESWIDGAVRDQLMTMGFRAVAVFPMAVGGEWLGYTLVLKRLPYSFTAGEMRVCESVNDQAATALRSALLYQEAQRRAQREQLIREITSKMRGTPDLDTILNTAVQELGRALGVSRAFVRLSTGSKVEDSRTGDEPEGSV
jgi:GAF domain-containing protein